ncbi:hypothetical protein RF11_01143 [Thelohanellus kitauei]|uniref:Uncharacterized protein n=1 Tax=Thelohanellus kitauei TaxID=669202 RepID=A0A0C2IGA3_THEKT|nr:hypothetical protein RF11_01143 [Thelohanellus kitauei]
MESIAGKSIRELTISHLSSEEACIQFFIEVGILKSDVCGVCSHNMSKMNDSKAKTNCWKAYNELSECGYIHLTVNHSQNFVDRQDRFIHTQNIENFWRWAKQRFLSTTKNTEKRLSKISEHLFRKKFKDRVVCKVSSTNQTSSSSFDQLELKWINIFAKSTTDFGFTNLTPHKIDTGDVKPFKIRRYEIPKSQQNIIEGMIYEMIKSKIISPSTSPWCSPSILKDQYPFPLIDRLSGAMIMSLIDLQSRFLQCLLIPEDTENTTIFSRTGMGLYQFHCLPIRSIKRLCNVPTPNGFDYGTK